MTRYVGYGRMAEEESRVGLPYPTISYPGFYPAPLLLLAGFEPHDVAPGVRRTWNISSRIYESTNKKIDDGSCFDFC